MISHVDIDIAIRILLAVLLSFPVGLEREMNHKNAGLKTHVLVCLGSAVFTILSIYGFNAIGTEVVTKISHDPARIAAQIIAGIGFIGGGAVLKDGLSIRGITTAATLWIVSAIGMAVGTGLYFAAVATTFVTLFVLITSRVLESRYIKNIKKS